MKVYLDNCVFNRPFDDQSQLRIGAETRAVLSIEEKIKSGSLELVWSFIIDYELSKHPLRKTRELIAGWKLYATRDIGPSIEITKTALSVKNFGIKDIDSLHIAAALHSKADCFVTTDGGILKKIERFQKLSIRNPIQFLRELEVS